jgi:diguanylate cyclase (GGDEF)-like protein
VGRQVPCPRVAGVGWVDVRSDIRPEALATRTKHDLGTDLALTARIAARGSELDLTDTDPTPQLPGLDLPRRAGLSRLARLKRIARDRRSVWAATALLVVAGTVGSVLGARSVAGADADKARLAFHLTSQEIASTLTLAIKHEEDLVVSTSAFVAASDDMSPTGFDKWAESVRALQRFPELQNIGLVTQVPARGLVAFRRRIKADPMRPLGLSSPGPKEPFQVLPPGSRTYYCFAVAGLARSLASYLSTGVDYCALAKTLAPSRDTGITSYAPFVNGTVATLGVETPVYRSGVVPATVAERRRAFVGWLGELLVPGVVLQRALQGHPNTSVTFRYGNGSSNVVFSSGTAPRHAQSERVDLHNGWSVQALAMAVPTGVFADGSALTVLVGGILLSVLLGLLVFVLGTGRTRALSLVREKTRELSHLALHDALTGLPNRALVLDRAEQMLARVERQPGSVAGALFIDIDGFKRVNDKLGHAAGDQLLQIVGERLQGVVRDQDTVGRLGGDEFVVLVESTTREGPVDLPDRIIEVLRHGIDLDGSGRTQSFTASVGIAVGQYATPDALLRDADLALYAAKAAGKDRYALFDASMSTSAEGRLELEGDLGAALREEQLFLHYQPIFDLSRHEVIGVEALVRWRHPSRGVVAPDEFIPMSEESGLILSLGRWVLREACEQAARWQARGHPVSVFVNVSAQQLSRDGFAGDVRRALEISGIDPSLLALEITETTLMHDVAAAGERLQEIKALGVRVAIDDFGTGYASLSQLQRMPVDILKIDGSFVAALDDTGQGRELLEAILGVGQALSLTVVAEGVETQTQLTALREMGCQRAQGYLLGRPAAADVVEDMFTGRLGRAATSVVVGSTSTGSS